MTIRGVLFDLDETLNDREASWRRFIELLFVEGWLAADGAVESVCRIVLEADAGGYRPKTELFRELSEKFSWAHQPTAAELEKIWRERFPACMVKRDGVDEVITKLKMARVRVGIVSNGREDMQAAKIAAMGLMSRMDCVVTSGEVGVKKPDRRIYEIALERLGCAAREALFVGDHPEMDVRGPREAGMKTAWLRNGKVWPGGMAEADYVIERLTEIIRLVESRR